MIDYDTLYLSNMLGAGKNWGTLATDNVAVYFQTALAGPGMSNVCVSSPHASSCRLKLCDWRGKKRVHWETE